VDIGLMNLAIGVGKEIWGEVTCSYVLALTLTINMPNRKRELKKSTTPMTDSPQETLTYTQL
jgi:hypothetical protein